MTDNAKYKDIDLISPRAQWYSVECIEMDDVIPESVWQSLSALANTCGGYIRLGEKRVAPFTFVTTGVCDPERIVKELWEGIDSRKKISSSSLIRDDVFIEEKDGKRVVVIHVPKADPSEVPVYINGSMSAGTYFRDGLANRRCTWPEVCDMIQYYSGLRSTDRRIIKQMGLDVIDTDSFSSYREEYRRFRTVLSGVPVDDMSDTDLMLRLGIARRGEDGELHPTRGGLLMFGRGSDIRRAYPGYRLVFRSGAAPDSSLDTSSGDWSGNIYDFFTRTSKALESGILAMPCISCVNDSDVLTAVREALVNCLVNADYSAAGEVSVTENGGGIVFSNPGSLKTDFDMALSGGVSCPRNPGIMDFFCRIKLADRAGCGLPMIYRTWSARHWEAPVLQDSSDRTTLALKIATP